MVPRFKVKTTRRKGRGVFANCRIKRGEIIEVAPVIILSRREAILIDKLSLVNYCFDDWGTKRDQTAFCLGLGSLYNHSYYPNATSFYRLKTKVIVFRALRDISYGEEITHNYNLPSDKQRPIKFSKNSWRPM